MFWVNYYTSVYFTELYDCYGILFRNTKIVKPKCFKVLEKYPKGYNIFNQNKLKK